MTLIVKGTPSAALQAARQRGIDAIPWRYLQEHRETILHPTVGVDVLVLTDWLCEPGEPEYGVGYPDGTLMFWRS